MPARTWLGSAGMAAPPRSTAWHLSLPACAARSRHSGQQGVSLSSRLVGALTSAALLTWPRRPCPAPCPTLQDQEAQVARKKRRNVTKAATRSVAGASLEVIQKKKSEKPEARKASREAALR